MRTLSADWMTNTSKPESELQPLQHGGEESKGNFFYPRPVAPTTAQVTMHFSLGCFYFILQFSFVVLVVCLEVSSLYVLTTLFFHWCGLLKEIIYPARLLSHPHSVSLYKPICNPLVFCVEEETPALKSDSCSKPSFPETLHHTHFCMSSILPWGSSSG